MDILCESAATSGRGGRPFLSPIKSSGRSRFRFSRKPVPARRQVSRTATVTDSVDAAARTAYVNFFQAPGRRQVYLDLGSRKWSAGGRTPIILTHRVIANHVTAKRWPHCRAAVASTSRCSAWWNSTQSALRNRRNAPRPAEELPAAERKKRVAGSSAPPAAAS